MSRDLVRRLRVAPGLAGATRSWGAAIPVGLLIIVAVVPLFDTSQFDLRIFVTVFLDVALAVGLVTSLGYCGQFNLSQGTFYGIGAYTVANMVTRGWSFELAIVAGAVAAGIAGLLFGIASLRVRGDYFALLSLAFTIAVVQLMNYVYPITQGPEGFTGIPVVSLFGITLNNSIAYYYATLGLVAIAWLLVSRIGRSFGGRAMLAVRYDEIAAQASGINVVFTKLLALTTSSTVAGAAGAFLVATVGYITPGNFDLLPSFNPTIFVIMGGMTSLIGTAIAAALVDAATAEFAFITNISLGLLGVVVLIAVFYRSGILRDLVRRTVHRSS